MPWGSEVYASDDELAAFLRDGSTVDRVELRLAVEAASRAIDGACGRQFGKVDAAESRTYETVWDRRLGLYVADIDDLATTQNLAVTVDGTALAASTYQLRPRNAVQTGRVWTELATESAGSPALGSGPCEVEVTAEWGWASVPEAIKQATLLHASRLMWRRRAPSGVAGSPESGSEVRLMAKIDVDAAVLTKIARYRRNRGFA